MGKTPKENKSDLPQLRVKMRYQTVDILPIASYNPLVKVLYTLSMQYIKFIVKSSFVFCITEQTSVGVIFPLISRYVDRSTPKCDTLIMNDLSYMFGIWLARCSSVSMSNALRPHGLYHSMCISVHQSAHEIAP